MDFKVSEQAVYRHLRDHAVRAMEKAAVAAGARDLAAGLGLNEEVADLQERTLTILTRAEKTAKTHARALLAIREARANLELLGKFTGKLRPEVEIHLHPEVVEIRHRLVTWIVERHPDEAEELAALLEAPKR